MPQFNVIKALMLACLLGGCSSSPIESPAPTVLHTAQPAAALAPAATPAAVAPVIAAPAKADAGGPAGASRIIYFDYDSYAIRPEFSPVIEAHARFLASHSDRRIAIEGHTDERGGHEYNLALGQQRAEAVRRALGLLGARASQLEAISFGEEKPQSAGHDDASWARNRRAEISYR